MHIASVLRLFDKSTNHGYWLTRANLTHKLNSRISCTKILLGC